MMIMMKRREEIEGRRRERERERVVVPE